MTVPATLWPPIALAVCCLALLACGGAAPARYTGLASSGLLQANPDDRSGQMPYRYRTTVDWRHYDSAMLEPVLLYPGPEQQFGAMPEAERRELASYLRASVADQLGRSFMLVDSAGPNTLRVRLTLVGAVANTPLLGTLSRLAIGGAIYHGVQAARGREGCLTGSATYAVEIYDALDQRLLQAYIARQFPDPLDLGASVGALSAAKSGIDQGATALLARLR